MARFRLRSSQRGCYGRAQHRFHTRKCLFFQLTDPFKRDGMVSGQVRKRGGWLLQKSGVDDVRLSFRKFRHPLERLVA